jgi:hypothetical protein
MLKMNSGLLDLKEMKKASRQIMADRTPEVFVQNLIKAVEACPPPENGQ